MKYYKNNSKLSYTVYFMIRQRHQKPF